MIFSLDVNAEGVMRATFGDSKFYVAVASVEVL